MTNFDDRFGGGRGFLGVKPANNSATLINAYNTSFTTGGGSNYPWDVGRDLPIAGNVYAGIAVPVAPSLSTAVSMGRGKRPGGAVDWATLFNTGGQILGGATGLYYEDTTNQKMYLLTNNNVTVNSFLRLIEVDIATGAAVTVWAAGSGAVTFDPSSKPVFYPLDPSDPFNSTWVIVYQDDATGLAKKEEYTNAGVKQNAVDLKVDSGGTNQSFNMRMSYMTADKQILIGSWLRADNNDLSGPAISFVMQRGSTQKTIIMPYDGNMPMPLPVRGLDSGVPADNSTNGNLVAQVISDDSVVWISDAQVTGTASFQPIYGQRSKDRVDLDRWFQAVGNKENFAPGEAFFA